MKTAVSQTSELHLQVLGNLFWLITLERDIQTRMVFFNGSDQSSQDEQVQILLWIWRIFLTAKDNDTRSIRSQTVLSSRLGNVDVIFLPFPF